MNFKLVLKTYSQLRQLTDGETALLNTLRGMSDAERELLVESLGPPAKVKTKPKTTRKIEHCGYSGCGLTKRARVHHDRDTVDYHEFVGGSAVAIPEKKSKRAESLAGKLQQKPLGQGVKADDYIDGPCGKCGEGGDSNVHHKRTDPNYHPFVPIASSVDESSSPTSESSRGAQLSTQSSEAGLGAVSGATGD